MGHVHAALSGGSRAWGVRSVGCGWRTQQAGRRALQATALAPVAAGGERAAGCAKYPRGAGGNMPGIPGALSSGGGVKVPRQEEEALHAVLGTAGRRRRAAQESACGNSNRRGAAETGTTTGTGRLPRLSL